MYLPLIGGRVIGKSSWLQLLLMGIDFNGNGKGKGK